jgi:hypothetical protein
LVTVTKKVASSPRSDVVSGEICLRISTSASRATVAVVVDVLLLSFGSRWNSRRAPR